MTKNTVIFIFLNMIYLLIWYATNKIRSTKVGKELDNGFEFYNSLVSVKFKGGTNKLLTNI